MDSTVAIRAIVERIRRVRPHVVITFGPGQRYGHPTTSPSRDFTTAAVVALPMRVTAVALFPRTRVAEALRSGVAKRQMGMLPVRLSADFPGGWSARQADRWP